MLAFMSPPLPSHGATDSSIMSLTVLPSQPYSEPRVPKLSSTQQWPAKRPKLSLNTNNIPSVFGKTSTSLRLETLSTTSPTVRNTFRNAHNSPVHRTSSEPALSPLSMTTTQPTTNIESAASSATTTTSSSSSIDSISIVIPYKIAHRNTSILINSPVPRTPRRTPFARAPMFPASKRVAFKEPLTEDVKTTHFTLRHSDIDSSTSTISTLELSPPSIDTKQSMPEQDAKECHEEHDRSRLASPHIGDKRESSDEEDSDGSSCPATPVADRRKRHRQWVWTLANADAEKAQPHQPADASQAERKEGTGCSDRRT